MIDPKGPVQRVYTFKQFCELFPISDKTLRRRVADDKIKTIALGSRLKGIPAEEVERIAREGLA
jgi:predicted site-specific integrase-resolvase